MVHPALQRSGLDAEDVILARTRVQQRALAECNRLQYLALDHGLIMSFGL